MYRRESDNMQSLLAGEGLLLELIIAGAPLPEVLDTVCTALDVQVGNVVSVVLFPDDEEHTLHTFAQSAAAFGLSAFSCTTILSRNGEFLGTLEMYSCFLRGPTPSEKKLIERATHLAALVIQNHDDQVDAESVPLDSNGMLGGSPRERPPSSN